MTNAKVYHHFLKGHHVIRETYSQYSGQATDITIERVLLRLVKSIGGLSYGCGWNERQWLTWLLSRPICAELNYSLQELTGKHLETSEQHLRDHAWCTTARMTRDAKDLEIILDTLHLYPPFAEDLSLRSITSGIIAGHKVNVDDARGVGMKLLDGMYGKKMDEYSFPMSSKVTTLAARPPVMVDGQKVSIDHRFSSSD